ncbi:hypothetical protein CcCBS67573_g09118 [Chytriomyces confervae]|uniref:Uncharacterized protein n=1 Tax=Chytriomyces confervae TaxID=246404 RepID=A0A507E6K7_9FUNG|nr:hypothetical protein CcCBS67573_g09118 [Chytriomyces confervae]
MLLRSILAQSNHWPSQTATLLSGSTSDTNELYSPDDALALKLIRRQLFGSSGQHKAPHVDKDPIDPVCLALFYDAASTAVLSIYDSMQECRRKQDCLESSSRSSSSTPGDEAEYDALILSILPRAADLNSLVPEEYMAACPLFTCHCLLFRNR